VSNESDHLDWVTEPHYVAPIQQGWQSPVCGRVYAPSVAVCFAGTHGATVISSTASSFGTPKEESAE
jgi:hypothetical protein